MSTPIGSSTTRSASVAAQTRLVGGQSGVASAAASAALGQADGSRPQVQSRRVSLKLGPLGITYSTDQVLWPEAAATAGAGAAVADASPSPGLDPDAEPVDAVSGLPGAGQNAGQNAAQAGQADQTAQAQQAGRSFHQELAQAWRRQIEARTAETYGPDGAPRSGLSAATTTVATSAEAGSSAPAAAAAASATGAAPGAASSATTPSAENTTAPPAARMRRAIGAYLACARDFSSAQPMLTAVA